MIFMKIKSVPLLGYWHNLQVMRLIDDVLVCGFRYNCKN